MNDVLSDIEEMLQAPSKCGNTHVIVIDGRAGAGKTTFAEGLAFNLSKNRKVEVLHLDEIYSGWQSALGLSLTAALSKITTDLSMGKNPIIQIFNWSSEIFDSTRTIPDCDVLIIEGVGSGQEIVRQKSAVTIWLEIDAPQGLARVLERDGNQIASQMSDWQISEAEHFSRELTAENSDFIFATD